MRAGEVHLVWPEERFYWSVLDVGGVRVAGPLPGALEPEFAEDVPVPVEELFAVAAPTACGRLLVCAARIDDLDRVAGDVFSVTPRSIPAALGVSAACDRLNVLAGPYEPEPVRRRRNRGHLAALVMVALLAGLIGLGLERRARHWAEVAASARAAADSIAGEFIPGTGSEWSVQAMEAELAALRARARIAELAKPPPDAALALSSLLRGWPADVESKPQSISITPSAILVSVSIEGDASGFIRALKPPPGWTLLDPRINSSAGISRGSLQLKPAVVDPKGGAS